ncbi:MAG: hypothetical protein IKT09_07590 [Synergistes sp.]|nr:hypothetical protein [Synergistes sp.]
MPNKVILFPDYEKMKSEVELLRTELSMLVLERDELLYVECRNIEMAYMLELGSLEYRAYEAQCTYLRLKRKAELIQAKKNRQEKIELLEIEKTLDIEFAEYQMKLNELIAKMNAALDRSSLRVLSSEETGELKRLYRRIVKALHPDLHPDIGEEKIKLFERAVRAYENGDLDSLRIIDAMVSEETVSETREDALKALVKEKTRLKKLIEGLKEVIQSIKDDYPYTLKEFVKDKEKMAAKKQELKEILEGYRQAADAYRSRIDEMIR